MLACVAAIMQSLVVSRRCFTGRVGKRSAGILAFYQRALQRRCFVQLAYLVHWVLTLHKCVGAYCRVLLLLPTYQWPRLRAGLPLPLGLAPQKQLPSPAIELEVFLHLPIPTRIPNHHPQTHCTQTCAAG